MAAPTINANLTQITAADATTGFSGFNDGAGPTPSPTQSLDVFIQGTASVSFQVSSAGSYDRGGWFDVGAGNEIDFTVTGRHFYGWVQVTTIGFMNAIASGGLYVKAASDAAGSNWSKWYVSGSDVFPGGWVRIVLDLNKTASATAATAATISSIRWIGFGMTGSGQSLADNLFIDRMDHGSGLQIEDGDGTTPASWQELFDDDNLTANKYGVVQARSGVFYLIGGIRIGDAAGTKTSLWDDDSGAVVVFEDPQYHDGTSLGSAIDAANLYAIDFQGNATGTTDITFGNVVGTGDDRQGVSGGQIRTAGPAFTIDGETDIADLDSVNLYGVTIQGAGVTRFSGATKTDIIGCLFQDCDEVQPNDAEFLNNSIISPLDRGIEMLASHNIKQVNFIANSDSGVEHHVHFPLAIETGVTFDAMLFFGFGAAGAPKWHGENAETRNTVTAGSFVIGSTYEILTVGTTDFTLIGAADNNIGTIFTATGAGSGTGTAFEVTQINATNGANPSADEFENTGATAGSVNVTNAVTLTVMVKDEAGAAIQDARVAIYDTSGSPKVELMNELTTAAGIASESYNFGGDISATVEVRKGSAGATKYIPVTSPQTITASGLDVTVTLTEDTINSL